jgi:hypothetical protein
MLTARIAVAASDRKGATDANCTRIAAIDAYDSLGYRGVGREEHSGENAPRVPEDLSGELADNRTWQLPDVRTGRTRVSRSRLR